MSKRDRRPRARKTALLTALALVFLMFTGIAGATQLRNIESITPLSGQEITIQGNISLNNNHWIKGVKDPTSSSDLITKTFADSEYLQRDGTDTMAGNLDLNGNSLTGAADVQTNDIYDDDSNFLRVQDSIDLDHNHEEAIRFDGDEAAITVHDGYGNFNILSGIDGNNVIRGGAGGIRQEFSDSGWVDFEIYTGSDDTTGSEAASFMFDDTKLDVSGANIEMNGNNVQNVENYEFNDGAWIDSDPASYGNIRIGGGAENNYVGLNLNGNRDWTLMGHTSSNYAGFYDDSNNDWIWRTSDSNRDFEAYYNGNRKLRTTSNGINLENTDIRNVDQIYGNNYLDIYSGSGNRVLLRSRGSGGKLGWYDDYNNRWVQEYSNGGNLNLDPAGDVVVETGGFRLPVGADAW